MNARGVAAVTGFTEKVVVVTGAARMRSTGRPVAAALAPAGCDVVIKGTGGDPERYPGDEKEPGWRDIDSVAEEVCPTGRKAVAWRVKWGAMPSE